MKDAASPRSLSDMSCGSSEPTGRTSSYPEATCQQTTWRDHTETEMPGDLGALPWLFESLQPRCHIQVKEASGDSSPSFAAAPR